MFPCAVWNGIDRQSFFEHAILLSDMRHRSQGHPIKMRGREHGKSPNSTEQVDTLRQMTPDFLDDFAVIASGPGGPDNVTAACLELSDEGRTYTLRVARNGGNGGDALGPVRDIIETICTGFPAGSGFLPEKLTPSCLLEHC